jgi:hypothetical protein
LADKIDVALTDALAILDPRARERVEGSGFLAPAVAKLDFLDYRYLVDVDGFSNGWGFLEKLMMGAAVVKVGSAFGYRQWYYDRLEPWVHFVPVQADFSDFDKALARLFADRDLAEEIAANGRAFAERMQVEREVAEAERRVAAGMHTPL